MIKYEITRRGLGFQDRHPMGKQQVLRKLRTRLKHLDAPYTFAGDSKGKRYNLEGAMEFARNHIDLLKPYKDRLIVSGHSYDQPDWVLRAVEVQPPAPMSHWLENYIGKSSYDLGGEGPPGPSDCSGATRNACRAVHGIELDHSADLQMHSSHIQIFHDSSNVAPDDFIFYNYGRLNWPEADHVEFIANPNDGILGKMRTVGSRPSTGGVSFYIVATWDRDNILCYGRLKT
jgi:hypothetical protein